MLPFLGLLRCRAAVNDETGAGHKPGIVGGEKDDALGDVVGDAEPANRVPRHDLLTHRINVVGAEIARAADKGLLDLSVWTRPGWIELTRIRYTSRANSSAADLVNKVTPPLVSE